MIPDHEPSSPEPTESGVSGDQIVASPGQGPLTGPISTRPSGGSIAAEMTQLAAQALTPREQVQGMQLILYGNYQRQVEALQRELAEIRQLCEEKNEAIQRRDLTIADRDGTIRELKLELRTLRGMRVRMRLLGALGTGVATFGGDRVQKPEGLWLGMLAILSVL